MKPSITDLSTQLFTIKKDLYIGACDTSSPAYQELKEKLELYFSQKLAESRSDPPILWDIQDVILFFEACALGIKHSEFAAELRCYLNGEKKWQGGDWYDNQYIGRFVSGLLHLSLNDPATKDILTRYINLAKEIVNGEHDTLTMRQLYQLSKLVAASPAIGVSQDIEFIEFIKTLLRDRIELYRETRQDIKLIPALATLALFKVSLHEYMQVVLEIYNNVLNENRRDIQQYIFLNYCACSQEFLGLFKQDVNDKKSEFDQEQLEFTTFLESILDLQEKIAAKFFSASAYTEPDFYEELLEGMYDLNPVVPAGLLSALEQNCQENIPGGEIKRVYVATGDRPYALVDKVSGRILVLLYMGENNAARSLPYHDWHHRTAHKLASRRQAGVVPFICLTTGENTTVNETEENIFKTIAECFCCEILANRVRTVARNFRNLVLNEENSVQYLSTCKDLESLIESLNNIKDKCNYNTLKVLLQNIEKILEFLKANKIPEEDAVDKAISCLEAFFHERINHLLMQTRMHRQRTSKFIPKLQNLKKLLSNGLYNSRQDEIGRIKVELTDYFSQRLIESNQIVSIGWDISDITLFFEAHALGITHPKFAEEALRHLLGEKEWEGEWFHPDHIAKFIDGLLHMPLGINPPDPVVKSIVEKYSRYTKDIFENRHASLSEHQLKHLLKFIAGTKSMRAPAEQEFICQLLEARIQMYKANKQYRELISALFSLAFFGNSLQPYVDIIEEIYTNLNESSGQGLDVQQWIFLVHCLHSRNFIRLFKKTPITDEFESEEDKNTASTFRNRMLDIYKTMCTKPAIDQIKRDLVLRDPEFYDVMNDYEPTFPPGLEAKLIETFKQRVINTELKRMRVSHLFNPLVLVDSKTKRVLLVFSMANTLVLHSNLLYRVWHANSMLELSGEGLKNPSFMNIVLTMKNAHEQDPETFATTANFICLQFMANQVEEIVTLFNNPHYTFKVKPLCTDITAYAESLLELLNSLTSIKPYLVEQLAINCATILGHLQKYSLADRVYVNAAMLSVYKLLRALETRLAPQTESLRQPHMLIFQKAILSSIKTFISLVGLGETITSYKDVILEWFAIPPRETDEQQMLFWLGTLLLHSPSFKNASGLNFTSDEEQTIQGFLANNKAQLANHPYLNEVGPRLDEREIKNLFLKPKPNKDVKLEMVEFPYFGRIPAIMHRSNKYIIRVYDENSERIIFFPTKTDWEDELLPSGFKLLNVRISISDKYWTATLRNQILTAIETAEKAEVALRGFSATINSAIMLKETPADIMADIRSFLVDKQYKFGELIFIIFKLLELRKANAKKETHQQVDRALKDICMQAMPLVQADTSHVLPSESEFHVNMALLDGLNYIIKNLAQHSVYNDLLSIIEHYINVLRAESGLKGDFTTAIKLIKTARTPPRPLTDKDLRDKKLLAIQTILKQRKLTENLLSTDINACLQIKDIPLVEGKANFSDLKGLSDTALIKEFTRLYNQKQLESGNSDFFLPLTLLPERFHPEASERLRVFRQIQAQIPGSNLFLYGDSASFTFLRLLMDPEATDPNLEFAHTKIDFVLYIPNTPAVFSQARALLPHDSQYKIQDFTYNEKSFIHVAPNDNSHVVNLSVNPYSPPLTSLSFYVSCNANEQGAVKAPNSQVKESIKKILSVNPLLVLLQNAKDADDVYSVKNTVYLLMYSVCLYLNHGFTLQKEEVDTIQEQFSQMQFSAPHTILRKGYNMALGKVTAACSAGKFTGQKHLSTIFNLPPAIAVARDKMPPLQAGPAAAAFPVLPTATLVMQ